MRIFTLTNKDCTHLVWWLRPIEAVLRLLFKEQWKETDRIVAENNRLIATYEEEMRILDAKRKMLGY